MTQSNVEKCSFVSANVVIILTVLTNINCKEKMKDSVVDSEKIQSVELADAASTHDLDKVKYILKRGVNIEALGTERKTALYECGVNDDVAIANCLLAHGANPNLGLASKSGEGPLHAAAGHGSYRVATLLLEQGADVNLKSDGGITPLHRACWNGSIPLVRMLVLKGAEVNAISQGHITPLHLQTLPKDIKQPEEVYKNIASFLIAHGARPDILDDNKESAGRRARRLGFPRVADVLDAEERRLKAVQNTSN